jgi:uncharacterized membrane protein HdeD (DUF308 family)
MKKTFRNFWFFVINGLIALLFGLMLLIYSEDSMKTVVQYFGWVVIILGVLMSLPAFLKVRKDRKLGWQILEAVSTIAIGIIIVVYPGESLAFFLKMIGVWAILSGGLQLVVLVNLGSHIGNKNIYLVNGLLTIVLGVILLFFTVPFASFVAKLIGLFAALFGILMIALAFAIRAALKRAPEPPAA